jgi:hypothetical protein
MIVIPFQDEIAVTADDVNVVISQNSQMDGDCNIYVSMHNIPLLVKALLAVYSTDNKGE